jgi:hypothetical protein
MKHALKALLIAGALGTAALAAPDTAGAQSASVSVRVDVGDVSVGYRNGYYDHNRRWHRWRSSRHHAYYRRHHRAHYHDYYYRHDRGRHRGWRHRDRD